MRRLRICVSEELALQRFKSKLHSPWARTIDRLFSRSPVAPTVASKLPRLETIWMPHYLIHFFANTKNGDENIATYVDAVSGAFALFALDEAVEDGEPLSEPLLPMYTMDDAIALARRSLILAVMSQRGKRRRTVVKHVVSSILVYHPFYIYYYLRRNKFIDFGIMDAVVGDMPGAKVKAACLSAFEKLHDTKQP